MLPTDSPLNAASAPCWNSTAVWFVFVNDVLERIPRLPLVPDLRIQIVPRILHLPVPPHQFTSSLNVPSGQIVLPSAFRSSSRINVQCIPAPRPPAGKLWPDPSPRRFGPPLRPTVTLLLRPFLPPFESIRH